MGSALDAIREMNAAAGISPPEGTPAPGEEAPSKAKSALMGFVDAMTMGAAPSIAAGQQQFDNPIAALTVGTGVGAVDAVAKLFGGGKFDSTQAQDIMEEAQLAHPGYNLAGEIAGSILPGVGMAKGGIKATEVAAKHGGKAAATADYLANTLLGRAATATTAGAGQGALTAANKDETGGNIAQSALFGGLAGGFGQAVFGEAAPAFFRKIMKSSSKTTARANIGKEIEQSMRGGIDPATGEMSAEGFIPQQAMTDKARELGPRSVMADVNPGAFDMTMGALSHPEVNREMYPVRNLMEERLGKEAPGLGNQGPSVYQNFEDTLNSLMPATFNRQAGVISEARAADTIKVNAKAYHDSLSPEYKKIFKSVPIQYNPQKIKDQIAPIFQSEGATTETEDAMRAAFKRLDFQVGQGRNKGTINVEQLHSFRTELDDMLTGEYGKSAPNYRVVRRIAEARNSITERLNNVPGFMQLNQKYASEASYTRAADLGRQLLSDSKGMSPERLQAYMASANPGDKAGFLEGLSHSLSSMMEKSGGEGATARKISRDSLLGKKLMEAFPSTGEKMIDAANQALALNMTAGELVRGSQTAGRTRARDAFYRERHSLDPWIVAGALWQSIHPGQGVSKAAGLGAAGRMMPLPNDKVYNKEIARLLSAQGETGMGEALPQIQQATDQFRLPVTLGGVDKALALRSGEIPPTLMNRAMGYDMGQLPSLMTGAAGNSLTNLNTPDSIKARMRRR